MKKWLTALIVLSLSFTLLITPALAATATDRVGVATSIYQLYLTDGATGSLELQSNVAGNKSVAEDFIYDATSLSVRLLPWSLDAEMQYYADTNPTTFFVQFRGRNQFDQNNQVQQKMNELVAQAKLLSSDQERIAFINDYLVDNCSYRSAAINNPDANADAFTIYGCLIKGSAVCEGYANSVLLFCQKLNIPCVKVTGTASGGNHVWNSVYLDNKWWMLDTTFNDPVGPQVESDRRQYFLLDMDTFNAKNTHTYNKTDYELSKQIITGRTEGQYTPVPFNSIDLTNATAGDQLSGQTAVPAPTQPETTTPATDMTTENKAEVLKELGLFVGDENGFRLEENMSRVEMGVMVMRLNDGKDKIAANEAYYLQQCIFTDVPLWAKSAIGYLYDNGLVAGQGNNQLGTGDVTKKDYAVVLLRVLNIEHDYNNAVPIALANGILTVEQVNGSTMATRGDIVEMTYAAIQMQQAA